MSHKKRKQIFDYYYPKYVFTLEETVRTPYTLSNKNYTTSKRSVHYVFFFLIVTLINRQE